MDKTERADLANALKGAKIKTGLDSRETGFCEMLTQFMAETGYTCKTLAPNANMSDRTIRRMKCDSDYRPTREMVISVCVAMKLSIYESRALLKESPYRLRENSPADVPYLRILEHEGKYSVDEWNKVLRDIGEKTLGCS